MARIAALRPHRRLALPAAMLFGPLLWFIARNVAVTTGPPSLAAAPRFAGQTVLAVVASYLGAALVVAVLISRFPSNPRAELLFHPDDATLTAFVGLVVAGTGYLTVSTFRTIPGRFDLIAAPVGLVLGLPLVVLYGGFVAVATIVPALQHGIAPFVVVGVGVTCSVLWTFLLTSILTRKFGS